MEKKEKRDIWVDNVKVLACLLVVLGHFFQSMVKSNIIEENSLYVWFNSTIYTFHVQLFFICSGYLYQKYTVINSFGNWKTNIIKKLLALSIPYLFFSTATWMLKKLFSSSVNSQIGKWLDTILLEPVPPYWYLYILFIIFFITLTIKNKLSAVLLLLLALGCELIYILGFYTGIYAIDKTMAFWIWFVLGMILAEGYIPLIDLPFSIMMLIAFIVLSILVSNGMSNFYGQGFIMGLFACYSIISIMSKLFSTGVQIPVFGFAAKYTMPIFLMHTIFAAPLRSIMLKVGITGMLIHFSVGLLVTFSGPIVAIKILEKLKPLDFIIYPTRYVKISQ